MDGLEEKLNKILSDPEALGSVMKMAQSIAGGGSNDDAPSGDGNVLGALSQLGGGGAGGLMDMISGIDPQMLGRIMSLAGEYGRTDDRRTSLLTALKPYVREERREKMERAAQIVRLARTARMALGSFGGGKDV